MRTLLYFLLSLRPKQWLVKNIFIFAPMAFSLDLWQKSYLLDSLLAFFLFSLITGAVYVFNDIIDRHQDQHHPQKRLRPIASGKLSVPIAWAGAAALLATVLLAAFFFNRAFFDLCLFYAVLNLLYSLFLKSVVIIDVMVIALGFVLRVMVGGAVNRIALSPWILITTFLLAIFLALIKRRQELIKWQPENLATATRRTLLSYNIGMIDQMISIATATTVISYLMWVLSPDIQQKFHTQRLYYTVPFVIFGIFRYLFLSYSKGEGESPSEIIYTDLPFTLNIILWGGLVVYLLVAA